MDFVRPIGRSVNDVFVPSRTSTADPSSAPSGPPSPASGSPSTARHETAPDAAQGGREGHPLHRPAIAAGRRPLSDPHRRHGGPDQRRRGPTSGSAQLVRTDVDYIGSPLDAPKWADEYPAIVEARGQHAAILAQIEQDTAAVKRLDTEGYAPVETPGPPTILRYWRHRGSVPPDQARRIIKLAAAGAAGACNADLDALEHTELAAAEAEGPRRGGNGSPPAAHHRRRRP
ncbi:MAG: hypothetical protein OXG35_20045 [Acidobacteria bacterium]|nr:hypothetical protein [Acidobacteriota bacterium]